MVRRGESGKAESDLDRIQELFPWDSLQLRDHDPLSPKRRAQRTKSGPTSRLQRVLVGKPKSSNPERSCSPPPIDVYSQRFAGDLLEAPFRSFIMDGPVRLTMGLQSQDRHLFLFNDLMLIAKPRSGGTYKMKERVRVSELWVSTCMADVCEVSTPWDKSFVIGWPTTNVVVNFSSSHVRELWQAKIDQLIADAKEKEGHISIPIQVVCWDRIAGGKCRKTINVTNRHTAVDCAALALQQLGQSTEDVHTYQLWVKTDKDDAPYPLIGHEFPFCIKMNFIRELLRRSSLDLTNVNNISTDSKCLFILYRNSQTTLVLRGYIGKRVKKQRKYAFLNWPFKRNSGKQDSVDGGTASSPRGTLFGQPLSVLCANGPLPKPILGILTRLLYHAPYTVGIFRKSANARLCREFREMLEANANCDFSDVSVLVLASVLKEFLRSLPDCVLQSGMLYDWLEAINTGSEWEQRENIVSLLNRLPSANLVLLRHVMCLLWNIAQNAAENKMTSGNLGVCIGPSLLHPRMHSQQTSVLQAEVSKQVPKLVAYLIDHCPDLFGEECLRLLGPLPEQDGSRQDSGAEESDSVHGSGGVYRRDDSSIDSLDRDLLEGEPSPKLPSKNKMSLTNLSRDSGLTLSDTQLYTPDEEMESESSSSGDGRRGMVAARILAKSVPDLETVGLGGSDDVSFVRSSSTARDGKYVYLSGCPRTDCHYSAPVSGVASPVTSGRVPRHAVLLRQTGQYPSKSYAGGIRAYHYNENRHGTPKNPCCRHLCFSDPREAELRRTTSEESLPQKFGTPDLLHRVTPLRAVHAHAKQQDNSLRVESSLHRSRHRHVSARSHRAPWSSADRKRSRSMPRIADPVPVHDSGALSVVSSDDSTPQVSRSNSAVQDLHVGGEGPRRVGSICSSSSEASQRTQLSTKSHDSQCSNSSTISQKSASARAKQHEPPSYEETMCRRSLLRRLHSQPCLDLCEQDVPDGPAPPRKSFEEPVRFDVESHRHGLQPSLAEMTQSAPVQQAISPNIVTGSGHPLQFRKDCRPQRSDSRQHRSGRRKPPEDWKKEISWSVAQLRTIFSAPDRTDNGAEQQHAAHHAAAYRQPPPAGKVAYVIKGFPAGHKRSDSTDSNSTCGEESYV